MPAPNVQGKISSADLQAIKDAIALIRAKMPFLIQLSSSQRRELYKMGPKSFAFVQSALRVAQSNPAILPPTFSTDGMASEVALSTALQDVLLQLEQLTSAVDDTSMAVGSECMEDASDVYGYVKMSAPTTPGLQPAADELADRWKHRRDPAPTPTPPAP